MKAKLVCTVAVSILMGSCSAFASTPCTLTAPETATAGAFFSIGWSLGDNASGTLRRDDRTLITWTNKAEGSAQAWATNVLGTHTYTMFATDPAGEISTCSATVNFVYAPAPVSGYDIVVVAGQSNGVGLGRGPFPAYDYKTFNPKVVQLGRFGAADHEVVPVEYWQGTYSDGLQFWAAAENNMTISFALSFAQRYINKGNLEAGRQLLIIPAAHDSTSIRSWLGQSGQPRDVAAANTTLYNDTIGRTNYALNLPGQNRVVAFLWQQGEADVQQIMKGNPLISPAIYKADLAELFGDVRRDIPSATPFPILAGLMVPGWLQDDGTGLQVKRAIESDIEADTASDALAAHVPTYDFVSNTQAGYPGGDLHFDADSQTRLGGRYYAAWANLMRPNAGP